MKFLQFDAEYVRRLTQGDAGVEEHFASYFGDLLFLKLRARLRSCPLIEDIRQETLMRVLLILRTRGGVEHPERFGAFVNAVSNNVMMELRRAELRHDPMDEDQEEPLDTTVDLDAPLVDIETKRLVTRVMDELPEIDRSILQAVYLEEMDKAEICRRHKVNANYLRVLLHRAKCRFRLVYLDHDGPRESTVA
ncbi:MAG: RNA polymerase sigma factor [Bryobacteraceae bacterium]